MKTVLVFLIVAAVLVLVARLLKANARRNTIQPVSKPGLHNEHHHVSIPPKSKNESPYYTGNLSTPRPVEPVNYQKNTGARRLPSGVPTPAPRPRNSSTRYNDARYGSGGNIVDTPWESDSPTSAD